MAIVGCRQPAPAPASLTVHCAAVLKGSLDEAVGRWSTRTGRTVEVQYGGSGTLLAALAVRPDGDVYIAADDSFTDSARRQGLIGPPVPLARIRPVLAVAEGNPLGIAGPRDLLREGVRVGIGHPEQAAIGRVTQEWLTGVGLWPQVRDGAAAQFPTVTELAAAVSLGSLDVAVVWDATAAQTAGVAAVELPDAPMRMVSGGVLVGSKRPQSADELLRFLADAGLPGMERAGG